MAYGQLGETVAEVVARRREEAQAAYDSAMASAGELRELAKRLEADAAAQEEQALEDKTAADQANDDLEKGA